MASSYTSNYQLCQWEGTDKVLRTDFNGDNAKIDEALAQEAKARAAVEQALAAETAARTTADAALNSRLDLQEIYTYTITPGGQTGTIYINNIPDIIDWSQWKWVHVRVTPVLDQGVTYRVMLNHSYDIAGSNTGVIHSQMRTLWGQAPFVYGIYWGGSQSDQFSCPALSYGDISRISLQTPNYNTQLFQAGTKIVFLGEKG